MSTIPYECFVATIGGKDAVSIRIPRMDGVGKRTIDLSIADAEEFVSRMHGRETPLDDLVSEFVRRHDNAPAPSPLLLSRGEL